MPFSANIGVAGIAVQQGLPFSCLAWPCLAVRQGQARQEKDRTGSAAKVTLIYKQGRPPGAEQGNS